MEYEKNLDRLKEAFKFADKCANATQDAITQLKIAHDSLTVRLYLFEKSIGTHEPVAQALPTPTLERTPLPSTDALYQAHRTVKHSSQTGRNQPSGKGRYGHDLALAAKALVDQYGPLTMHELLAQLGTPWRKKSLAKNDRSYYSTVRAILTHNAHRHGLKIVKGSIGRQAKANTTWIELA